MGVKSGDIAAIGIANQRETTIVWDRDTGESIAPAIVWQDRRTSKTCDQLMADKMSGMVRNKTGLLINAYFSATKIHWLLNNVKGARARARRGKLAFGTVDSWLIWNLTGGKKHVTDVSNAARTMLFDIHKLDWDDGLLELFGIPRSMMPKVCPSSEIVGETSLFGKSIPISGIAGDQQAALFGQACFRPGMAKNTARGAAYLAGLAVGFWPDRKSLEDQWKVEKTFRPKMKLTRKTQLIRGWETALKRTLLSD